MNLTTDILATLWSVFGLVYLIWFALTGDPIMALRASLGFIFLVIFAVCLSLLFTCLLQWCVDRSIDGFTYVAAKVPFIFFRLGGGK